MKYHQLKKILENKTKLLKNFAAFWDLPLHHAPETLYLTLSQNL